MASGKTKPDTDEDSKPKSAQEKLREVVTEVARTPAGKKLFRHLHGFCGFVESDSRRNPQTGEINPYAIVHNAAVRNVYLELRKHIPKEFIIEIEH